MRNKLGQFIKGHKYPFQFRIKIGKTLLGRYRGSENPNWQGGRWKDERGYIRIPIKSGSDKYVYEHRLIMEQILGRKLKDQERVHHINGIKDDNRKENLLFVPNEKAHKNFHQSWNRGKKGTYSLKHSGQFKKGQTPWNKGFTKKGVSDGAV
jgi:HNH endonuclease